MQATWMSHRLAAQALLATTLSAGLPWSACAGFPILDDEPRAISRARCPPKRSAVKA